MPILHANNIQIYYEQHGQGDDLILIGGLSADHQVWKTTLRLFSQHFRVTVFDNRGAGQSSAPDFPYTTELMAHDVLGLMNILSISRAHIVGQSMGGCIAQQLCLIAPEKVNKCVTACTRAKPSHLANMILSMREKLEVAGVNKTLLAEYILPFLFSESFLSVLGNVKGFIQWTLQNSHPQTLVGFKSQLHAVKTHNIFKKLSDITIPTLVIAGKEDILMPSEFSEEIAQYLKNSQLVIMNDCAHMPHVEKPQEFAATVLEFLNETITHQ